MALIDNDRYAGEAAWREWFAVCSVAGCGRGNAAKLRAEIESAMTSQLLRCGFSVEDAGGDDPVAFFDSYFKLKGSREKGKPLKLYFAHRIQAERLRMLDFVCGTLFGSRSGRIHDIVVDWISSHRSAWTSSRQRIPRREGRQPMPSSVRGRVRTHNPGPRPWWGCVRRSQCTPGARRPRPRRVRRTSPTEPRPFHPKRSLPRRRKGSRRRTPANPPSPPILQENSVSSNS